MNIGGYDLLFEWPKDKNYIEIEKGIINLCKKHWPRLVIEYDDLSGGSSLKERSLSSRREFFIYQDAKAKSLWDKHGVRRITHNSMIYVIIEGSITIVVDNPRGYKVKNIIKALNTFLVPI